MFVSAFFIIICISSSYSEPIEPITHSPGIYFDPTTVAYFYNDYWNVITNIEFTPIKPYLDKIEHSLSDVFFTCNKLQEHSSLHIDCNDTVNPMKILISANKLKDGSLSQLVSANDPYRQNMRFKRGLIDGGGKILNFFFGTLDSDDAKRYDEAFNAVKENEQELYSYMQQNIQIVRSTINVFNDTITKLNENEKKINKQLQKLNKMLVNLTKNNEDLKHGAEINSVFNLIEGSLMSVSNILDTVLNSILFSKANILHPYVLTPSHLYEELLKAQGYQRNLGLPGIGLTLQTIHSIIDLSKLTAYYYNHNIVFVMQIPLISPVKYNIYKNLALPTPRVGSNDSNLNSYVLIHPTKLYTAITDDKLNYALLDSVRDCQDVNGEYNICPLPAILSTMNNPTCETKLMTDITQSLPKMCESKVIYGNINLWQKLNDGRYIYVQSKPNKLSIKCPDNTQTKDYTIEGTGILTLGKDCVAFFQTLRFKSSETYVTRLPSQITIDFNIVEDNCCKFKLVNSSTHMLASITLDDVDLESLKSQSAKLDQMEENIQQQNQVEIMPHIVKYGDFYSALTIVIITSIMSFIIYSVVVKCRNSSRPVILHERFP
ncbi:hypothetical protein PYW08_005124 [Mythimna loreyi]|uniref:Uncharacterized protein n=1 Tax=Mythimna loreyi TaxID=667449 RepID=A0ACC2QE49_9NEOP|nr:hypothetical protein PYW08_005124 [Mythimna loreyi]